MHLTRLILVLIKINGRSLKTSVLLLFSTSSISYIFQTKGMTVHAPTDDKLLASFKQNCSVKQNIVSMQQ